MKQTLRFLLLLAALLLPVFTPRAAAQTYNHHDRQVLTDALPAMPRFAELSKDGMAVDQYRVVYSAGYQDFIPVPPLVAPAGRRGVVLVHAPSMAYIGKFVSLESDSVYTGIAVKATGLEIWVVGTRLISTTNPQWFCERWKPATGAPGTWTRTHVKNAATVPGIGGGASFGGSIQRYSMGEFLVSGSWTAGSTGGSGPSKLFARALRNSNLSLVWSTAPPVSEINAAGRLGGLDGQTFAWGRDVFRWHPRAFLSSMSDARFYLGGTIGGDIWVNRFHRWDGHPSLSFNNGPPVSWTTPVLPDLMTALMGLPDSGVYICGVSQNPDQGFLYSWTRGTPGSLTVPRAGVMPYLFGPDTGVYDVKVQTVGPLTHMFVGGRSTAMGGGWVWHFDHTGPTGAAAPAISTWPFLPYAASPHPWLPSLPVYGLDLLPPAAGNTGDLYATGQHALSTGGTGQIAMRVQNTGTPMPGLSWSSVPFPPSGTGRWVAGHTIRFAGSHVFSHGNGHTDNGGMQSDGEVMAFTP